MRKTQSRAGSRFARAGLATVATAAAVFAGATPAFAGATLVLSTSQASTTGGTVVYVTGGTGLASTQAVRFVASSGSCPTTYDATTPAGTVNGGLITAIDATTAYFTTPALAAGTWKPCFYLDAVNGAAYGTDTLASSGTTTLTTLPIGTTSPTTGAAADRITLTNNGAPFTGTTYVSEFVSGATSCPTTYSAASSSILPSTSTTKTSTSVLTVTVPAVTKGTAYLVCSYAGSSAGSSALTARGNVTFASYDAALPTVTLNPTGGSSGVASTVTLTVPSAGNTFAGTPDVLVTRQSCPLTRPANSALGGATNLEPWAATTSKISNSKLAVTMPTAVIVGGQDVTTAWNVCTYASSTSGSALTTSPSVYTVAPVLTVSGVQFAVGSGSASGSGSGPAQGGSNVTFSGLTGIPTAAGATLSATLGGSPITGITPIDATSFSGTTTSHAAGQVSFAVTTAAGTKTTATTPYTYTYGITVAPNTAPNTANQILDITGAGFGALTFGNTTTTVAPTTNAYVLLTNNAWNAQTFSSINAMATAPVSYCNNVLPISDTEIVCTLNLLAKIDSVSSNAPTITTNAVPNGAYTVTVVNNGTSLNSASYNFSIVSSGSTFTVSPY